MNRKFTTWFAVVCIAAALGAGAFVAYRILALDAAGREAAKVDFEGLRSVLAYVRSPSDLADPGLRARLASRYEASPGLLLADVYERGSGDRWRIPADSPYLVQESRGDETPTSNYPPASTILLSSPLKGDSTGRLALDALYVSLPQVSAFGAFRDALTGLGAFLFLAVALLVLVIVAGRKSKQKQETNFDFSSGAKSEKKAERSEGYEKPAARGRTVEVPTAEGKAEEESFADEWEAEDKAAAAAHYQFETLAESGEASAGAAADAEASPGAAAGVEAEVESANLAPPVDEEFDIPVMDMGLVVKTAPEEIPAEGMLAGADAASDDDAFALPAGESSASPGDRAAAQAAARADAPVAPERQAERPAGLYSPSSGLGWESYMKERLDAEISRSASFEQDLSLLIFSYDGLSSQDEAYASIGKTIKGFFSFRDLAFERGDDGFSIILPNIDSSHALRMAEEFNKKLVFLAEGDFAELDLMPVYMGISSRAGRLIDAARLIDEASTALDRARYEKDSHIVAFRPDPDKYRQFLAAKN
jgi:GGDEF domain-containing protein